jgi:hypothetical protein
MVQAADIIRRDAENSRISLKSVTLHDLLDAQDGGEAHSPPAEE